MFPYYYQQLFFSQAVVETESPLQWLVEFFRGYYDGMVQTIQAAYFTVQEYIANITQLVQEVIYETVGSTMPSIQPYLDTVGAHVALANYWLPVSEFLLLAFAYISILFVVLPIKTIYRLLT